MIIENAKVIILGPWETLALFLGLAIFLGGFTYIYWRHFLPWVAKTVYPEKFHQINRREDDGAT